ncbi:hypothetical protein IMSHALPRED_000871 [Imshaugia aleurites]|uniref:Uncharacterized protein n=1 Tax=Imshaugia aleurites TaxID=172621 RepID=A0A8H3IEI9_9LECA|nr:hypothetical protein IMSHALPRED_000871 [Imshaugia aleurites]
MPRDVPYKYKIGSFVYFKDDKHKTLHRVRDHRYNQEKHAWEYMMVNVYEIEKSPADWTLEGDLKRRWLASFLPVPVPEDEKYN